jgi:hypothetical protein
LKDSISARCPIQPAEKNESGHSPRIIESAKPPCAMRMSLLSFRRLCGRTDHDDDDRTGREGPVSQLT